MKKKSIRIGLLLMLGFSCLPAKTQDACINHWETIIYSDDNWRYAVDSSKIVLYGDDFKNPITGYQAYFDVRSFVDYFIISEISRNGDAYKKSRFLYKDKESKDGLLHAGPPWDLDWAWKNLFF